MQLLLVNSTNIASKFSKKITNLLKFSYMCIEISNDFEKIVKYERFKQIHKFHLKAKMPEYFCLD